MSGQDNNAGAAKANSIALNASSQAIVFPPGMYRFSVRISSPILDPHIEVPFPAFLVAAGPTVSPGTVEFIGNPSAVSSWLLNAGDNIAVKITGKSASLILSSFRTTDSMTQPFDINVEQLNFGLPARTEPSSSTTPSLKLQVGVHLHGQENVQFSESDWVGRAGSGVWIEAISISAQEALEPTDIEYKGLVANGFETPWLSDGAICGTKGANVPLVGFAARLKPKAAAEYDCEYSLCFRSGAIVGPLRNGIPGRSKVAGDPLEAIQIRVVKRAKPAKPAAVPDSAAAAPVKQESRNQASKVPLKNSPKFGAFRDEGEPISKAASFAKKISKSEAPPVNKTPEPVPTSARNKRVEELPSKKVTAKSPDKKLKTKSPSKRK